MNSFPHDLRFFFGCVEVIWYHNDQPIKESNEVQLIFRDDHCSLFIQEAFHEDMGIYQVCSGYSQRKAHFDQQII